MEHTAHLWLFFIMVFGVVLLPGVDMALVMASALVDGRRLGLTATAGIILGGACHVAMAALGLVAVLQLFPAVFNAVLLVGALYIAWIGWTLLRSRAVGGVIPIDAVRRSPTATFRKGLLTSLLNPKAYLFMLAVFPQFLKPEYGRLWVQALVLWIIIASTQAVIYGGMALLGDSLRGWLQQRPDANILLARALGTLLLAMALITAVKGWQSL